MDIQSSVLMENLESLVQTCVDFVLPTFRQLASETANILDDPLAENSFPEVLVQLKWPAIQNGEVVNTNLDAFVVLVATRAVSDTLTLENDSNEEALKNAVHVAAVILDFCFHSRLYRQNPSMWSNSYFGVFSSVIDCLSWPNGLVQFWPYAESRIEWFKMCNSVDPVPVGTSNLVSYKQPLYDKLRHWNDLLTVVQNNNYLNTPLHYEMKFKVEKFLSELLPIAEESNFNRSAAFSTKQSSGNPWNKTISSSTRTDASSENVFATDFNYVYNNLITNPLEFIYKPLDFKIDLDKALGPLLDAIFEIEEDFYKTIKTSHKNVVSINEKLNLDFPSDFETKLRVPNYITISESTNKERKAYWADFLNLKVSLSSLLQPTLFDTSVSHPPTLYDQIMELENDYFRKQFILQLCFTMNLIRQIVTSSDVENYYKSCYQKERPSRSLNFDSLNEANHKKTVFLCDHLLNNRISKFYHHRDPLFNSIIQKLLKADEKLLKSKMDGLKSFNSFEIPSETPKSRETDYSFKKFGFVLLGNKSMSNVWKTKTGLDEIQKTTSSAQEIFEDLHTSWSSNQENGHEPPTRSSDMIIKEWQTLRRLRSQYLFDFSKVDEDVGIEGLFSTESESENVSKKRQSIENMLEKLKKPHLQKLEAARNFNAERLKRKRELEEEQEHAVVKQRKLNEADDNSTPSLDVSGDTKETDQHMAPAVPTEEPEDQAELNNEQEGGMNEEQVEGESEQQKDTVKQDITISADSLPDRPKSDQDSAKEASS